MRIKQLVTALSSVAILVGCTSGVNSSAASQNIDLQAATKAHAISQSIINDNLVFADSLGVLPLSEASGHNYLFRINNTSAEKYTLVSLSLDGKSGETEVENEVLSASAAACSSLDAYSSCSIQLTPKATKSANSLLIIKLKDSSGKIKELHQMVRMSDSIFSADGIAFANDLDQVVTADGNYSIALPVILSADFDDIKVANGSLQCDGGYYKGNACTYLISGKSLSDNSIVSAEVVGYRAGTQVAKVSEDILVKTAAQASLLMSQGNTTSDHATSEVVVYNNGNTAAYGLKLAPDAQLKIVSGAECLSHDLPAHSACSLKVTNSSESSGYAALSLRAADADIASTQIRNAISREKVDLSFSPVGSLQNTLINTIPASQTITVKNTSDRELRNFNIQLASVPATPGLKIDSHNCTSLAKNQTCSVELKYAPNSIVSNSVNLIVTATYTDDSNDEQMFFSNYPIAYSSIQGSGVLSSSEFNDFEVVSDGVATQRQTFKLSNTKTGIDTKLTAIALETAVPGLVLNNGTCAIDTIIKGGKDCSGSITYGGVNKPVANLSSRLKYSYSITSSNSNSYSEASNTFKLNAKAYAAIIEAGAITVVDPKPLAFEGDGSKDKPYKFIALKGRNPLVLEGKVTNKGNAPAQGFKITGLDNSLINTTGTCSLTGQDLKPNESCTLKIILPADSIFATSVFNHTSITDLALTVSYSYTDQSSTTETQHAKLTKHIQFTRNWANVEYDKVEVKDSGSAWDLSVTATHRSVNSNLENDVYPITITPAASSILNLATVTPCQISKANSSCVVKVSFPKTNYPASSTQKYKVNMESRGRSLDAANAVSGQVQFEFVLLPTPISLLSNYRYEPRLETHGVASIGYPQVCIRTNTYDSKLDYDGIFKEIAQKHPATELLNQANKYAASGDFGHTWTILFNSPDKWTSWSYRFPVNGNIFTGSPLQKNHSADSPNRKFSYQYCVNVNNRDTSEATIEKTYIPALDAISRDIASKLYPGVPLLSNQGVYTMATPCVWFAAQIFQKLTGKEIVFEQPFDWKMVANITNQPTLAVLKSMPDPGVVAEFITRKIKFSGGLEGSDPYKAIFTADRTYVLYDNKQITGTARIENNSYFKSLAADFENIQAGMHHNNLIYLFMRSGNISVFDLNKKELIMKEVSPGSLFSGDPTSIKDIPFKDIRAILPAYGNLSNKQWILLQDMRLLEVNFVTKSVTLRDINDPLFHAIADNLPFKVNEIIGATNSGGTRTLFLSKRRYADIDSNFRVTGGVNKLEEHPVFGKHFIVQ